MSAPRYILPGITHMVQRRTTQRQFLLRPSPMVNQVFGYSLALAASEYEIEVHAVVVMSTHYHAIVTDTNAQLPKFMWRLNHLTARCFNAYYNRSENFWAGGMSYSQVYLADEDALLEKLVYLYVNPVEAGLVRFGVQWPGLRSNPGKIGTEEWIVERPDYFFSDSMPEAIPLRFKKPRGGCEMEIEEIQEHLRERVREKESDLRKSANVKRKKFLGPWGVRSESPFNSPKTPAPRGNRNPRVACRDRWLRIEIINRLTTFLAEYERKLTRYRAGEHDVIFPAGTYWMRVFFSVRCEEPP